MNTETLDLGNNEQASRGIFPQTDGTFLAMTFTKSKTFKTHRGARNWLSRQGVPMCMCGEADPKLSIGDDGLERTTCCGCH